MANRRFRRITAPNLIAWAELIKRLNNQRFKGYTVAELVDACGLNICTVQKYLDVLHQRGAAYIEGYELDTRGAYSIRRWKLGQDDDAIPPQRSRAARAREQRHREALQAGKRANGVNHAGDVRAAAKPTGKEQGKARLQKGEKFVLESDEKCFEASHGSYSNELRAAFQVP
jgi:hypothetical protein